MDIFDLCPRPGSWEVPWDTIHHRYSWIRELKGCPQNPRYHAEGDVWVHTRMVCESMAGLSAWRELEPELRQDLFAAALLHDAAKPECTKVQANGRVTSRGHARRGAFLARRLLWQSGVPAERRERICALVRHHMVPLYLRDSEHRDRQVKIISQSLRCDLLGILGRADAEGRVCEDPEDLDHRHAAFETICRELGCFNDSYRFPSPAQRFHYVHQGCDGTEGFVPVTGPEVILLSGLPGAGKKAWVESRIPEDYELIEVDRLRTAHGISWRDNQGAVISAARDHARELLTQGRSFVWLDMNLGRQIRDHLVRLFAEFRAHVRMVYLESDVSRVLRSLEGSESKEADLKLLLDHWEPPEVSEAHELHIEDWGKGPVNEPDVEASEPALANPRRGGAPHDGVALMTPSLTTA